MYVRYVLCGVRIIVGKCARLGYNEKYVVAVNRNALTNYYIIV